MVSGSVVLKCTLSLLSVSPSVTCSRSVHVNQSVHPSVRLSVKNDSGVT